MQSENVYTPDEHYSRGVALMERGHGAEGFEHLSRAYLADPQSASFRSAYALGLALVRGQFLGAVELARAAVRDEFYNPSLYLNLARIYGTFGFKAEAIRYLKRGLMVEPGNSNLQVALSEFGMRRRPPIRFLPRGHMLNRMLGRIQARLISTSGRLAASSAQGA